MPSPGDWKLKIKSIPYLGRALGSLYGLRPRFRKGVDYRECSWREDFFRKAFSYLTFNGITGDYAEFGCHGGVTFSLAHQAAQWASYRCTMWAFDSFQGFPAKAGEEDEHPRWIEGRMATTLERFQLLCDANWIPRSHYKLVPGFYAQTLTENSSAAPRPSRISFAYVDCDLYSSTVPVLKYLLPRVHNGSIIAFDDYYCFSEKTTSGERRARLEIFGPNSDWRLVPYIQYASGGMSFLVENRQELSTELASLGAPL
jgi:O-methyltransferase